jgi:hypothetical protein
MWLLAFSFVSSVRAEPNVKTPTGSFEVCDWAIFVCDPNQPQANAASLYPSTLPDFAASRRAPAPPDQSAVPQPIGVIRFKGDSGKETIDVQLTNKAAKFLALWPKAQTRSNAALWQNYLITRTAPASLEAIGTTTWWEALRSADAPFVLKDGRGEKFLLYDAEPNFKPPLRVADAGKDKYTLTNTEKLALHDLTFYKEEPDGWHTAVVESLNGAATKPANKKKPTTGASANSVALEPAKTNDAAEVLAPWKEKLTSLGVAATDADLMVSILRHHGLTGKRLSAIGRLDAAEMDDLLPLEITPEPRKTVRVGLVIIRNIDPAIAREVDELVAQLGDKSWEKRQAAQTALAKLGAAAKPKLEALHKSATDPEVIYRIEQLLGAMNPAAPNPNGG